MDVIKRRREDPSCQDKKHNNFMTWYVMAVLESDIVPSVKTPEAIAQRLLLLVSAIEHICLYDISSYVI